MAVNYFDCYEFLLVPLWLLGWNPYKKRVRLQKIISTTCVMIHVIGFILCLIKSFTQHYDTPKDAIIVIFFGSNMTTCVGKHCHLFFCRQSFETVVDFFNNHLTPEEEEFQTVIKHKTKPLLKVIYPFLGISMVICFLLDMVPIIQKYCFGIHETMVPLLRADIVPRSLIFGLIGLSSLMYNTIFITFCEFISAHMDLLIYQISHITYERGYDKSELRKSLKRVMQRHAAIITANELRCNAFYWMVFLQLSVSTACMCFAMLHLEDTSLMLAIPYQFVELCIFCHFGQRVENKSDEIAFAFYSTPWPEMDPSDRKLILVALHISQKPLQTSGGPFSILGHETLKNVLQSAYSYYAVLKEIQ